MESTFHQRKLADRELLPSPVPKQIEEVKNEHLENFDKQNADEKEANPMYDPNDLL